MILRDMCKMGRAPLAVAGSRHYGPVVLESYN